MNGNKILVLTSVYPGEFTPKGYTPVVHYFVKEWLKLGLDVRVIYDATYFPSIYYLAPRRIMHFIQDKFGIVLPDVQRKEESEYVIEGVHVQRIAMKKLIPMAGFSDRELMRACEKVYCYIQEQHFVPDVIISHWANPQLLLMSYLKQKTGAFAVQVLHESGAKIKKEYNNWQQLYDDVDVWGYRSLAIKAGFESAFGIPKYSFRCLSGIPKSFCEDAPVRDGSFHNKFIQVGVLMERKYPHKTIEGVVNACEGQAFNLTMVGDGAMMEALRKQIDSKGLQNNVFLCGRVHREEVRGKLDESDVFILISKHEVFGLVYIEAMARGCIVIASRGQGMDGIIEEGVNGFFCEAGNSEELADIIRRIQSLSDLQRATISLNAQATAKNMTDTKVSKDYIETVLRYKEMSAANSNNNS